MCPVSAPRRLGDKDTTRSSFTEQHWVIQRVVDIGAIWQEHLKTSNLEGDMEEGRDLKTLNPARL